MKHKEGFRDIIRYSDLTQREYFSIESLAGYTTVSDIAGCLLATAALTIEPEFWTDYLASYEGRISPDGHEMSASEVVEDDDAIAAIHQQVGEYFDLSSDEMRFLLDVNDRHPDGMRETEYVRKDLLRAVDFIETEMDKEEYFTSLNITLPSLYARYISLNPIHLFGWDDEEVWEPNDALDGIRRAP